MQYQLVYPLENAQVLGPCGHDFSVLATCLEQFLNEEVVFVPNHGNAGDALINLGTFKLLNALGIRYVLGSGEEVYPNRVIIRGGGGALVNLYKGPEQFFLRNHKVCRAFVLLPSTVRAHGQLIADMDERCILFAREKQSFSHLQQHCTTAQLHLGHDMAFMLSDGDIAGYPSHWRFLAAQKYAVSWAKMITKINLSRIKCRETLFAYRKDSEATDVPIPDANYDLSQLFSSNDMSFEGCVATIKTVRQVIRRFRRLETNRLHISVLAALAGRDTVMRDNSYGKNRDVYDHSIKNYFTNVTFS